MTYSQRVIAEPPSPFDSQVTAALLSPATATGLPGAGGALASASAGVAASDAGDSAPVPTTFTARTLNRYFVPFVSPVAVWPVVDAPPPGTAFHAPQAPSPAFLETCHSSTGEPPSAPAVQVSAACRSPAVAVGLDGADGDVGAVAKATDASSIEQASSRYAAYL